MKSASNIKALGTIMGVWAHPDDEAWWSSGVMMAAIANGQKVICVTATRGHAGQSGDDKRWPRHELGRVRETELAEALSVIGVHELHMLGHRDGQLAEVDAKAVTDRLGDLIDKVEVKTILTFEPKGVTGHRDHKAVSKWSVMASKKSSCRPVVYGACETKERYQTSGCFCDDDFDIYFQTKKPVTVGEGQADLCFRLSRTQARQKLAALRAHQSQTEQFFATASGKKYMKALSACECFVKLL